jgi:hypothetical protein
VTATPTPTSSPTTTPPTTPTATITPTPPPTATPPPRVGVVTEPTGGGRLRVTVTARTGGCAPNGQLQAIRVTEATNAVVDVGSQPIALPGPLPVAPGSPHLVFTVRRAIAGQATHVNLVVTDGCGEWPTFVGGGPNAF